MPLEDVLSQPRALEILQGALRREQVHHAYLFGGPEGAGKELTALRFMQALNCEQKPAVGCGACGTCTRIGAHSHPDMHWVMPEVDLIARKLAGRTDFSDTPSREVKIAQVRKLTERLSLKALSARRKVAVILKADRLNVAAQNALLKTLEEPPADTTIILVSTAADALLPTIRSRCLRVPFVPLPLEGVAAQVAKLRKLSLEQARLCARLAQGSLSRALELDAEKLAERATLFERLSLLPTDDARPALRLAEELAEDRASAEWALAMVKLWLRDLLLLSEGAGPDALINADLAPALALTAQRCSPARLLQQLAEVDEVEAAIARNGSPRMQLERLLLHGLA
jgi:DNA polymerase-3 subunit delta'